MMHRSVSLALAAAALLSPVAAHESCLTIMKRQSQAPAGAESEGPVDPASAFVDRLPLRENEEWDIATSFPYPRRAEFSSNATTWSRSDLHPNGREFVFDTLGELYCLPIEGGQAKRILAGVEWDVDPRFSADGTQLLYVSDAGQGAQNVWMMPYTTCDEMDIDNEDRLQSRSSLWERENDATLLMNGEKETSEARERRLRAEGRFESRMLTNETYRFVTAPAINPNNASEFLVTRWYTSTRSIGAGEIWTYPILPAGVPVPQENGRRVAPRKLPTGGTPADYGSVQMGPEMGQFYSNDQVIYAQNMADQPSGTFQYSKNVHNSIYSMFLRNITAGTEEEINTATPGGASRPQLSHDRKTLAYVKRVESRSVLAFYDFDSGENRHVWGELTPDQQALYAPGGTYPGFQWSSDDSFILLWARGSFWKIYTDPSIPADKRGERINFKINYSMALGEKRLSEIDLSFEEGDTQPLTALREFDVNEDGTFIVFNGGARTHAAYLRNNASTTPFPIPTIYSTDKPYFTPSLVPGTESPVIIHARWDDQEFSTFEMSFLDQNIAIQLDGFPRDIGRYQNPVVSTAAANGDRTIAFVRSGPTSLTGQIKEPLYAGIWVGTVNIPTTVTADTKITITNPRQASTRSGDYRLRFSPDNTGLYLQGLLPSSVLLDIATGETTPIESSYAATEVVASPSSGGARTHDWVAFQDYKQAYLAPATANGSRSDELWSKPGEAPQGIVRLSVDSGHDLTFSKDGSKIFWVSGPEVARLDISRLSECSAAIAADQSTFGYECIQGIADKFSFSELRYKTLAAKNRELTGGSNKVLIYNADILTMEEKHAEPMKGASMLVVDGRIKEIGYDLNVPEGTKKIDAEGAVVMPGLIDSHAHWSITSTLPAKSWNLRAQLAYGITTLHNPSNDNVDGYVEREMVESGYMLGSRIYHTGNVLYGADGANRVEINRLEDARQALRRIKKEGGPASFSGKNYNQPVRSARQRFLLAAKEVDFQIVPEGGMNFDMDLTHVVDGTTTNEHNLPIETLYPDVIQLFAATTSAISPTNIVSYAEKMGELYLWRTGDLFNDFKLLSYIDRASLEETAFETIYAPNISFSHWNVTRSNGRMFDEGVPVIPGGHGETPLGRAFHWELESYTEGMGIYSILRAATYTASKALGIYKDIGTLKPGKLADFIVFKPGCSPLDDITFTRKIRYVGRGGAVYKGETLEEVYPKEGRTWDGPQINYPVV